MEVYQKLPIELRRLVKRYFRIHERKGWVNELDYHPSPYPYYHTIRTCPQNMVYRYCPDEQIHYFYYRPQKNYFDLRIQLFHSKHNNLDFWDIDIFPKRIQFKPMRPSEIAMNAFVFSQISSGTSVPFVLQCISIVQMDHKIIMTYVTPRSPLASSRQWYLDTFHDYLLRLSHHIENLRHMEAIPKHLIAMGEWKR